MGTYDIHCHMLPGIDDGPEQLEDALAMARVAAADGTRVVVATPHAAQVAAQGGREALVQRVVAFNHEIQAHGIGLEVVVGSEHFLNLGLVEEIRAGEPVTLNGSRFILVEVDFLQYPPYTEEALFQIQVQGKEPVLAHPERQNTIQKHPDLLAGLVEHGVVCQITAGSLLGQFGRPAQKSAKRLLKRNLVHLIASDGHSQGTYRPPVMSEATRVIERLMGKETAWLLAEENPKAIASNGTVRLPEARPSRRLFTWFGRGRDVR